MAAEKLNSFELEGKQLKVIYVETMQVTDGVICHVYEFEGDVTRDLAVIEIEPGAKTPLQKVLLGDNTLEGYLSGKGSLSVTSIDGNTEKLIVDENTKLPFTKEVKIGEKMQWKADKEVGLTVYEICYPPYQDGRYQNLTE
jgi:hypothetical protein